MLPIVATHRGLYIHCPFCSRVCPYCDFAVMPTHRTSMADWVVGVQREAQLRGAAGFSPGTLYLGGGTPSTLDDATLDRMETWLAQVFPQHSWAEATVECNPESLSSNGIARLRRMGFQRFSLGVQSFHPESLQALGRNHTAIQAHRALELLAQEGVDISLDLMFGTPGQQLPDFLGDIADALRYPLGHLSFYGLSVEPGTLFHQQQTKGKLQLPEDLYDVLYTEAVQRVEAAGLQRYEVSNFARPGKEAIHNRGYWQLGEWLGLGPGAHSYIGGVRWAAPRQLRRWLEWVEHGCPPESDIIEILQPGEKRTERIWLSLRMREGLDLDAFALEFPPGLPVSALREGLEREWIAVAGNRVQLRGNGWLHLDSLVSGILNRI